MLPSEIPKLPTDLPLRGFPTVATSPPSQLPPQDGYPSLNLLSFFLLCFILPPFKENGLPFWVPSVLCQHSEVVLWKLHNIQRIFWWIYGGESGLPILFLCHLRTTPFCPFLIGLFIYLFWFYLFIFTLQYCIGFAIHWHESTMGVPSWTPLPPPSPSHPSGSSQCTSPKYPVSCIEPGLAIHFTCYNLHVSMPFSHIILPLPSPTESKRLFYTSVSLFLSRIHGYHYHLSKFHIYALVYCIGVFLSGLLHSV